MPKLPSASGDKHITAFKRAGWKVNHIEGSHHILIKEKKVAIFIYQYRYTKAGHLV